MPRQKQKFGFFCFIFVLVFSLLPGLVFASKFVKEPGPILHDALFPPDKLKAEKRGRGGAPYVGLTTFGAGFYDTSEFMIGSISVGIILPESNGALDVSTEDWTAEQEEEVFSELKSGFEWWAAREPRAKLSFTYHFYSGRTDFRAQTSYEPINRNTYGVSDYFPEEQNLWISEIMRKFGYGGSDYFYQTRAFLNDMRKTDKTDWAFLVFVVNSANDEDGKFPDGRFAFSYYGGPFMIMTYDNDGYGISNMDAVAAHEMGHIFYALDQYEEAKKDCTLRLGYLNYENQNSLYNSHGGHCKSNIPSIMRSGVTPYILGAIDKYAKGQVGWADDNKNKILDAVDSPPKIKINKVKKSLNEKRYYGRAQVLPQENKNSYSETLHSEYNYLRNNITNNTISTIKFRINKGKWQEAIPSDGSFDSVSEKFFFTVPKLKSKDYSIEIKAETRFGNVSRVFVEGLFAKSKIVAGAKEGFEPKIIIFDKNGKISKSFFAFSKSNKNGVKVAACDIDGNGQDEIVAVNGVGQPPQVKIFSASGKKKSSFYVFPTNYSVNLACGDVNGDGKAEIVVGNYGEEPWVEVLDKKGRIIKKFFVYDRKFKGGVYVATGDVDGDGKQEIIVGPGFGGGPQVRVFRSSGRALPISFWPYQIDYHGGVYVTSGDVDGDGKAEIITLPAGSEELPQIKIYRYDKARTILNNFLAYPVPGKVSSVVAGNISGDKKAEVIGAFHLPYFTVKIFSRSGRQISKDLLPFGKIKGGAYLAVGKF